MSRKGSSTYRIQRSLEEQSCRSPSREKLQRLWCFQRRVDGNRVEHFPRVHIVAALWQNQQSAEFFRTNNRIFHRKNSQNDKVQRHLQRQERVKTFAGRFGIGQMVFYWTRFWGKVVFFREQSTRSLGPCCGRHVAGIRRKRTSYVPCNDSIVQGSVEKQKTRKTVYTLHRRSTYSWYNLSHYSFCQSAQCLRSSGSYMRGIWGPSR